MTTSNANVAGLHLDHYSLVARIAPWFVVLSPLLIVAGIINSEALNFGTGLVTSLGVVALATILAHLSRGAGKRVEHKLWSDWGGPPTSAFLRHRDCTIDAQTKARYLRLLESMILDWKAPTPLEEARDPSAADRAYSAAVMWLRSATRDNKRFPLVFAENVSYGFRRNLYGIRIFGILASLTAGAVNIALIVTVYQDGKSMYPPLLALLAVLLFAGLFTRLIKPSWVQEAATGYAHRLLETIDQLSAGARATE